MTAIRSETWWTTPRSCAMKTYVSEYSSCRSSSRLITCAWIETSSAETGSSATISCGFSASARAPPDLVGAADAVDLERVRDDLPHAPARVQRRVRILEDHLQLAPVRPQLAMRERRDVGAAEPQRPARRLEQPDEQPAE